ncbi:hypothetical protein BREV_BREV_02064 [Brevundimonas mediterranea]|uniref:Uncharacterized protein n=1 Tax=Brevundimonas mediterranea TaxID=74329 RepID=A0A7Z8Y4T1_9CAUL|nr:hypothetical protein BREV_BREV_02064 [Brevundimonas mediterranea]
MEGELAQGLAGQGDQAGVVGAGRDLGEPDLVALDEQFDAEDAPSLVVWAAERLGDLAGDVLRGGEGGGGHGLGLPALDIVALDLAVTDGGAEVRAGRAVGGARADGQQGDLEIEVDPALDDDAGAGDTAAVLRIGPGVGDFVGAFDEGLPLAGRGHDRLDETGVADGFGAGGEFFGAAGEGVGAGGQAKLFGGEAADALAVHGQLHGAGGGDDDGQAGGLDIGQDLGGDGLDLGHDDVRGLGQDDAVQHLGVGHRDDVTAMRDLHGGGVGIAINGDHLDAEPLKLNGDLLAQFARAEEHDADGGVGEGGAEIHRLLQRPFSPCGRRWPGGPDEGSVDVGLLRSVRPLARPRQDDGFAAVRGLPLPQREREVRGVRAGP